MSDWAYILLGWSVTGGAVTLYALRVVVRGRILSRAVPEDRRRWTS